MMKKMIALSLLLLLSACSLWAETFYDVTHEYDFRPGAAVVPHADWVADGRAFAEEDGVRVDTGIVVHGPEEMLPAGGTLGPVGIHAKVGGTEGNGRSAVQWDPALPGVLKGSTRAWGEVVIPGTASRFSEAYAKSNSTVIYEGGQELATGHISWWRAMALGVRISPPGWDPTSPAWGTANDPVRFEIYDLTTEAVLEQGTMLSIGWAIDHSGGLTWGTCTTANHFQMQLPNNGTITAFLGGPYVTSPGGMLSIGVGNGIVASSSKSGIFAGYSIPAVGSYGYFEAYDWTNKIEFDYALPALPANAGYRIILGGGGEVYDAWAVPEPGSLLALGSGLIGLAGMVIRRRR